MIDFRKEELDHFEVRLEREEIAFTESARIFVQAKDASDQDVELPADRLVTLSVTANDEYGTFIDQNNDTLKTTPVRLEQIPYRDVKAGLIQFAAVKKNPVDPVLCKVKVELEGDPTKAGEEEIAVVEQTLRIVMEGERKVEPRNLLGRRTPPAPTAANKKEFTVQLTRNNAAVAGHSFVLTNDYIDGSGGHDHITPRRVRNRDNYGYFILKRTNTEHDGPYNGQTQDDGRERFEYVASVFGDRMLLRVETTEPNKKQFLWDTLSVVEKVEGLIKVPSNENYELKGRTTAHPDNHYIINQVALDSLVSAAKEFQNQSWNTTGKMLLNDISLENGGGFDINGNWETDIVKGGRGHLSHRQGKNIDIENLALKDTTVTIIDKKTGQERQQTVRVADVDWVFKFAIFMKRFKWDFFDEGQTESDVSKRTRRFPHFDWKGN